ncbi:MAG TPA: hypothetical protein VMS93_06805, partial [Candidatus Saccharimonadales bacterium]|nr:hypothetical protein [Candidatus Saccharimonadales bacterium]
PRFGDQPPVTQVFLQAPIDTISYRVRLYWSGNDPDGSVVGFDIQFTTDGNPPVDSAWQFTTATDSIFALPIPALLSSFTFWVRAVDNAGLRDPHPAHLVLNLRNHPPSVAFINLPQGSHLAAGSYHFLPVVTLQWQGADPEGENTIANYHLWLDGGSAGGSFDTLLTQADTVFTLRMENFGDVSTTRTHTVHLSVVDEAQAWGDTVSYTWQVDAYVDNPGGPRVLLVDNYNVDPVVPNNATAMDSLYRNGVNALTSGRYTLYETFTQDNFRFPQDAAELFRHFDLIVWYNEGNGIPTNLNACGGPLGGFLEHGGRLFLSSLSVVGDDTALTSVFHQYYLGVRQTYCMHPTIPVDCNYTLFGFQKLHTGSQVTPVDSLAAGSLGFASYVDFFVPTESTSTEFYMSYTDAGDDTTEPGYIKADHVCGVTRTVAGGGRATFLSFPLYKMNRYHNREAQLARMLQALYQGASHRPEPLRPARRFAPARSGKGPLAAPGTRSIATRPARIPLGQPGRARVQQVLKERAR